MDWPPLLDAHQRTSHWSSTRCSCRAEHLSRFRRACFLAAPIPTINSVWKRAPPFFLPFSILYNLPRNTITQPRFYAFSRRSPTHANYESRCCFYDVTRTKALPLRSHRLLTASHRPIIRYRRFDIARLADYREPRLIVRFIGKIAKT